MDREKLRDYVALRAREEAVAKLGAGRDISERELRRIVDGAFRAGNEEIDYHIRRLVKRAGKNLDRARRRTDRRVAKKKAIPRFDLSFRIQHMAMAASILVLIVTGAPIKFHESWLGEAAGALHMVDAMKIVHRVAAAVMAAASIAHVFWVVFTREGWNNFLAFVPKLQDVKDLVQMLKFLFGKTRKRPWFGRFNYIEKFDYWAVYWGVILMLGTGLLMTFNTYFMNALGAYSMHIAKLIHSDEALLASLALLIWHFYWAHFNPDKFPMNKTFLTGTMTLEEMILEHPAELEERVRLGEIPADVLTGHPDWLAMHPDTGEGEA